MRDFVISLYLQVNASRVTLCERSDDRKTSVHSRQHGFWSGPTRRGRTAASLQTSAMIFDSSANCAAWKGAERPRWVWPGDGS